ncbi:hypothetical protein DFH27DRAFT_657189 [Peziza echinospora]|nr:hypothetical protein DFH27DRAFT_657189 [Peziza echinospora]
MTSALWHTASTITLFTCGMISKAVLHGVLDVEVVGLEGFVGVMEERERRRRERYRRPSNVGYPPHLNASKPEHGQMGVSPRSLFFHLGQILPVLRLHRANTGSPYQPTFTRALELLTDPVSPQWIHVFPEGRIHQHPELQMRYFKWGVSRLLLEPPPPPLPPSPSLPSGVGAGKEGTDAGSNGGITLIPMWIQGFEHIMHESRTFPRFVPRLFAFENFRIRRHKVKIVFGEPTTLPQMYRERWRALCAESGYSPIVVASTTSTTTTTTTKLDFSDPRIPETLKTGREAQKLRSEVAAWVRGLVVELRRREGWAEEEADAGSAERYKGEGMDMLEGGGAARRGRTGEGAWDNKDL